MSEIADAFDDYLRSLNDGEWDELTKRVRSSSTTEALDLQIASDPHMMATLESQIMALQSTIGELDARIVTAVDQGNAMSSIMNKQERFRLQTALSGLQTDLDERRSKGAAG